MFTFSFCEQTETVDCFSWEGKQHSTVWTQPGWRNIGLILETESDNAVQCHQLRGHSDTRSYKKVLRYSTQERFSAGGISAPDATFQQKVSQNERNIRVTTRNKRTTSSLQGTITSSTTSLTPKPPPSKYSVHHSMTSGKLTLEPLRRM